MNELFNIQITNRIEIVSRYNFNKELDVIIYDSNNVELYRTKFNFVKDVVFWIGISQLNNIIINILDENDIIYSYKDINDDFVYITCGDIYYMDLIEKLVISLLNVSDKKIIVYGINCKVPFDYPNLIKKEITLPIKTEYDKWFWKQESCIEVLKENYNNYVWLDGDIIANINIDSVSKYFSEIENYPIGEIHVLDEQIIWTNGEGQLMAEYICEHFNIERKFLKKDLHACFFVFNKNCKWFFQEILDLYKSIYDKGLYYKLLRWNDETLHNFMHNKYKFNKTLPLSNLALLCEHSKYESNPKVLRFFYGYWNEDSPNNFGEPYGWNYVPADKNQILYFHENKNLKDADEMIEFIKMKNNDSFNSSKWFFIDKYNLHNFEKERLKNDLNDEYDDCKNFEYKDLLNIAPNDIVLDIGAGIGFFERYCYLKNASKIICFEPDEHKFELLKLNAHKDTILLNADVTNTVDNYIIEYKEYDKVINTYSIDYLFKAELIDKIDLLKIDNKGKEESILIGIGNDNLQKINKISIKWYNFSELDENKRNEIIDSYLKKGFNCFVYNNINFTRLYFYKKKVQTNLIESNDFKKKVISFSIYGDISKYTIGLLKNLELVQSIYTGWSVYVYYNNTVPLDIIDKARQFDFVELFDMTNFKGPGVLWRFIPHNNVERFISRDADSRISLREKYAVDEWIKSGKSLHIMRDHPKWHNVKIFAGMFGLVIQDNYNLESIVEKWVEKNSAFDLYDKGQDTFFLNEIYDKYLEENDIIAHDSYHIQNYPYSFCFPSKLVDYKFVGEIYDENDNRQEHYQDWINKKEISEGYVTFVNNKSPYLELTDILVDSVLEFSTRSIEVFAINFDYKYKPEEDRIIRRRIDTTTESFRDICFCKTYASLNSSFDYGIQLDGDMIITPDADKLFRECYDINELPKGCLNYHDPNNQEHMMNYLNVSKKTQPYVYGTYLFNYTCNNFFKELYSIEQKVFNFSYEQIECHDETLLNVLLWKYNSNRYVDLYIPYYEYFIEIYLDNIDKKIVSLKPEKGTFNDLKNTNYYICHGCKDVEKSRQILERIKNKYYNEINIYHHLGMGDHFVCNAIVRNYSKLYNNIFLFVKPNNYDNVKFMYRDLKNINYLVGDDEFAEDVIKDKKNVLKINFVGKELDCNFDEYFYRSINMDFEKMWTDYYCKRDMKSEKQLFDDLNLIEGEYIFIQEDVSRNILIDRNRIRTDLKIVESDIKYSIFEYQYILENAKEIHLMESSFKCLVDHLDIKGILYFHKYMRYYPKHIESTIRNIKMITYE